MGSSRIHSHTVVAAVDHFGYCTVGNKLRLVHSLGTGPCKVVATSLQRPSASMSLLKEETG
jgi:hypothetical protein